MSAVYSLRKSRVLSALTAQSLSPLRCIAILLVVRAVGRWRGSDASDASATRIPTIDDYIANNEALTPMAHC